MPNLATSMEPSLCKLTYDAQRTSNNNVVSIMDMPETGASDWRVFVRTPPWFPQPLDHYVRGLHVQICIAQARRRPGSQHT